MQVQLFRLINNDHLAPALHGLENNLFLQIPHLLDPDDIFVRLDKEKVRMHALFNFMAGEAVIAEIRFPRPRSSGPWQEQTAVLHLPIPSIPENR